MDDATRCCQVDGCDRRRKYAKVCSLHYFRLRRFGTTDAPGQPSPEERFWAKVQRSQTCWTWLAWKNRLGYGYFWSGERTITAHRWSYLHLVGPIPDGQEIDHLCKNPSCVRPEHLEAVTSYVNNMRSDSWAGRHARAEVCVNGHELTDDNVYQRPDRPGRQCRACRVQRDLKCGRTGPTSTHCKNGHPLSGDNVKITSRGRRCLACARAARAKQLAT